MFSMKLIPVIEMEWTVEAKDETGIFSLQIQTCDVVMGVARCDTLPLSPTVCWWWPGHGICTR